jgi:hypothetical protein
MAQNYTQNATQSVTARRNAVAILEIAPLAAAISVSPAPLSDVETLEARLVVTNRNGLARMYVSWSPEQRPRRGLPVTTGPPDEVRKFSNSFA